MVKEGLFNKKSDIFVSFLSKFPLAYNGILKKIVGNNFQSILDVGCGTGLPMQIIKQGNTHIEATGVDIFKPYLEECKKKGIYKKLVQADVRKLPFKAKTFDVVICFHVLEHLDRKEGLAFIKNLEKIAKKRVVFALPIGHLHQEAYDGNIHQEHKSEWYPKDFQQLGYSVVGQGLKAIYKEENIVQKYGVFSNAIFFFSMLFQPLLFIKPDLAVYMFCRKEIE